MEEPDDLELETLIVDAPDVGGFLGAVTALGGALIIGAGGGAVVGIVAGALVGISLESVLWGIVSAAVGAVVLGLAGAAILTHLVVSEIERWFESSGDGANGR